MGNPVPRGKAPGGASYILYDIGRSLARPDEPMSIDTLCTAEQSSILSASNPMLFV
jgi:hypothetical protein